MDGRMAGWLDGWLCPECCGSGLCGLLRGLAKGEMLTTTWLNSPSTPAASRWEGMRRVGDDEVARLEEWIDALNDELPPIKEFILPGGGPVGAFFHQARTVCRRSERHVLTLMEVEEDVGDGVMRYLNRLSDWLFVAGRWAAKALGEEEYLWSRD